MSTTVSKEVRKRVRLSPETRRAQIVAEASRLISQSGFNAVSLADIAEACDLRKPSVLHYFPSMNHLLAAVVTERDIRDGETFTNALGAQAGAPPRQVLRDSYTQVLAHNLRSPEMVRLHVILGAEAVSPEHPAHDHYVERGKAAQAGIAKLLTWKDDPTAAAIEFIAFWEGLELAWCRDDSIDAIYVWDCFCERFFE